MNVLGEGCGLLRHWRPVGIGDLAQGGNRSGRSDCSERFADGRPDPLAVPMRRLFDPAESAFLFNRAQGG